MRNPEREAAVLFDGSAWSGEGDLTIRLVEILKELDGIAVIRVEDAPASRTGAGYSLIANEIFVAFATERRRERVRWLGIVPVTREVPVARRTLLQTAAELAAHESVGPADYSDEGMLQFLRAERVIQPCQTRGFKRVELVRVYDIRAREGLYVERGH